jgi:hypothetical protein
MAVCSGVKKLCRKYSANPAPMRTVVSAGLSAGFGVMLFFACVELCEKGLAEMFMELAGISIVAVGVVIFLEPLAERFRQRIDAHGGSAHVHVERKQRWYLRFAAFGILAGVSVSHALLHKAVAEDVPRAIKSLGTSFVVPAVITCGWIFGRRAAKSHAAVYGAIAGAVAGALWWLALLLLWFRTGAGWTNVYTLSIFLSGAQWGVVGFFGGLALDRRWGVTPARAVAPALVVALVATGMLGDAQIVLIFADLARGLGWAGGLLVVEPAASIAFGYVGHRAPIAEVKAPPAQP